MLRNRSEAVVLGLVFVAGALLGWFVHESENGPMPVSSPALSRSQASGKPSLTEPGLRPGTSTGFVPTKTVVGSVNADVHPERSTQVSNGAQSQMPAPPGDPHQLFSGGDLSSLQDMSTRSTDDRSKLHTAYRLSCQFGSGVNAQVSEGTIQRGDASWQGGVINYDVLDAEAGRATMSGTAGATGSSTGTVEVRMAGTDGGLSFSSIVPRGDLITTTVFAQRNAQGEFPAVMSTHAARTGHMASQFYGACTVQ
jgi:hypothetical protein